MRLSVDAEPLHANGAARHALGGLIERTPQRGEHIGAGSPILADGDGKFYEPGPDVPTRLGDKPVADHRQRHLASAPRGDSNSHGVARPVFWFVERDLEQIGRIGGGFRVPS